MAVISLDESNNTPKEKSHHASTQELALDSLIHIAISEGNMDALKILLDVLIKHKQELPSRVSYIIYIIIYS